MSGGQAKRGLHFKRRPSDYAPPGQQLRHDGAFSPAGQTRISSDFHDRGAAPVGPVQAPAESLTKGRFERMYPDFGNANARALPFLNAGCPGKG
jgi:hypothetical protein